MIERAEYVAEVRAQLRAYPVVCLLGARQVGKTTLARQVAAGQRSVTTYDLEDPDELARLAEPMPELRRRRGLIVLDEIQRRPELFPVLRVLADERSLRRRFLVLGSASPSLLKQSSETLAGRIAFMEVMPLDLADVPPARWSRLWVRGGFPRSFLAASDAKSLDWRRQLRQTFLERDLPMLDIPGTPPAATLARLWTMLAHVHGELLNWSELGRSMGLSDATVRRYADVLEGAMMIRLLRPWHENISKRQVRAPKLYLRDSGLLHMLLGLRNLEELDPHPRVGASWEGFLVEQLRRALRADRDELYFWRTEDGAELDLLFLRGRRRVGFEIKRTSAPRMTPSMHRALEDLSLDRLFVIHAGEHRFMLRDRVEAVPWTDTLALARALTARAH
ncbi:MAG: ATP-binding protein [Myxococcales bacterium]|nr:ATP-binding protein [Myxococcales bacterium]